MEDLNGSISDSGVPVCDVTSAADRRSSPPACRRASADGGACSPLPSPTRPVASSSLPVPHAGPEGRTGGCLAARGSPLPPPAPPPSAPVVPASKGLLLGRPGKLIRDRPISRSERHLKAASTPEFHSGSSEDVCCRKVRRPWSQLYSDAEAEQLFAAVGSMSDLDQQQQQQHHQQQPQEPSPLDAGHQAGGLPPRYSSLRASNPRLIADSVLQKFRKTFSLRFQRSRKGSTTSLPGVAASAPASTGVCSALLANGTGGDGDWPPCDWSAALPAPPLPSAKAGGDEEEGGFLPGPTILRSSCERRLHRKNRELRGSKCSSADSGIQLEALGGGPADQQLSEADSTDDSSQTSIQRQAESISAVITINGVTCSGRQGSQSSLSPARPDAESAAPSLCEDNQQPSSPHSSPKGPPYAHKAPPLERQFSTPPPIKTRIERSRPTLRRQKGRSALRRSISQPLDLEKSDNGDLPRKDQLSHGSLGLSDQEASRDHSTASSDEDFSSDGDGDSYSHIPNDYEGVTYVEALWDHVTLDSEELAFQAGEVIEVTDMSDKDWWWGSVEQRHGWFPAAFVRLKVGQSDTVEDCITKMAAGTLTQHKPRKMSIGLLSNEEVRAKVVMEIVNTERDFVHHLKDVVEGYLAQVRRRPDMFSEERRQTIFGNIEHLYEFQSGFLKRLESAVNWEHPHLSEIGCVFVGHRQDFKIYSEYCNNHPLAVSELQEVYADPKYVQFFEACRLLQDMIGISLDGFLLTPVQKICKYPLQLAELLKYTRPEHPDYRPVQEALAAMRGVAQMVNERKRRMECLEKLAEWQSTVYNWEGPDLLDTSSMLVHSGEAVRVSSLWSRDVVSLFLFDNLLIYCKKDIIKRNTLSYKGRLNMNSCCVVDVENGKDAQFGTTVRNAWKIYCTSRDKWYLFFTKTAAEKEQWLQAFFTERDRVRDDREQGYVVTESAKKSAKMAVNNKLKPKRPRAKLPKGPRTQHPDVAVVEILLEPPGPKPRTGSLPSTLHTSHHSVPAHNGLPKKKGSGWFHFGSGKKVKKVVASTSTLP